MKYPAHRHLLSISVLEPSNVSLGKSGSWGKKKQHQSGSFFKKKQSNPLHPMAFKLWVSLCTEERRKILLLAHFHHCTWVTPGKGALQKYLSALVSTGERQQPPGKDSASTTPLKYKFIQLKHIQKLYFFYLFQLSGYFPQLPFHTKSRFHSSPMDPVFLAPG